MRLRHLPVAALAVSACVGAPFRPASNPVNVPVFAPMDFFLGRTEGDGVLKVAMSRPRSVHIVGDGKLTADGSLALVQRIETVGKMPRTRSWSLRPAGSGSYSAALTDAIGPVSVGVEGNLLHLRFRAKGHLTIEQWVTLRPGGRVADNLLEVRKFGVRAAVLRETIRKIG